MSIFVGPENIQYRIRKNQSRATTVGITYWMATIVLLVFSVFPYVGELSGFAGEHLWVVSFLDPILELLSGKMTGTVIVNALAAILYFCMFFFSLCNFIIATSRLFRITKKNPTNKLGYNRASRGTKTMGKAYGRMFFWALASAIAMLLLTDGAFTLFFYIAFVFALIFHFVCNFSACKISYFQATDDRFRPIERIRTESRAICLIRNAWQFISIFLIVIFADRFGLRLGSLFDIVEPGKAATLLSSNLLDGVVLPAILFMILVCLVVAIRHAAGVTEYNENGTKGRGMKTCRIVATLIAVLAIIGELVVLIVKGTSVPKWAFLAIFTVAVQWVVAENMFLELSKKKEELEAEELKLLEEMEKAKETKNAKAEEKAQKKSAKAEKLSAKEEKKAKKDKKKQKKLLEKERLDEILSEVDSHPADPFGEFEKEESLLSSQFGDVYSDGATAPDLESASANLSVSASVNAPVEKVSNLQNGVSAMAFDVDGQEDDGFAKTLVFPSRDKIQALALKKKWMAMADNKVDGVPKINVKGKELVACPRCKQKLTVKVGATAVKCPTCSTKFRLKRRAERLAEYKPAGKDFDMQAYIERMREMQVELDAKYLAEAEEELRVLMESEA